MFHCTSSLLRWYQTQKTEIMQKFTVVLLSVVFVTLVIGSIKLASADHSLGDNGVFMDENNVNLATIKDSKYQIHVQIIVRDGQGQLVSVTEATHGYYIPHEITDQIFDEYLGKKEIITIDKMRYEKAQFIQTETYCQNSIDNLADRWCRLGMQAYWSLNASLKSEEHGNEQGIVFIPVFNAPTSNISLEEDDSFTLRWIILRDLPS